MGNSTKLLQKNIYLEGEIYNLDLINHKYLSEKFLLKKYNKYKLKKQKILEIKFYKDSFLLIIFFSKV